MQTVSFATASRSRIAESLPLARETLKRTRSYATTARQLGVPEITLRQMLAPPPPRAEPVIRRELPTVPSTPLSVREIVMLCCAEEGLQYADVMSQCRRRYLALPRQRMMWLVRQAKPNLSLPDSGRRFGGRDHTTVIHAIKQVDARYQNNDEERARLDALTKALAEVSGPRADAAALDFQIAQAEANLRHLRDRRRALATMQAAA
jgi:hypothetical protein